MNKKPLTTFILVAVSLALAAFPSSSSAGDDLLMPYAKFRPLPFGRVLPEGWLKNELKMEAGGITGHQPEFCFPFDRKYWAGNEKGQDQESRNGGPWWYPWEQMGYWTDGAYRCAWLAGDEALKNKALEPIRYTLAHPIDGWFLGAGWHPCFTGRAG